MRILFIIFLVVFLANCRFKQLHPDNALIEYSINRLEAVLQKKITDTATASGILENAFELADKYANKRHDSLIAWACRAKANTLREENKIYAARDFYLKGLQYGTRNLSPTEDIIIRLYRNTALCYFSDQDCSKTLTYLDSVKFLGLDSTYLKWKTQDALRKASCYEAMGELNVGEHFYLQALPDAKIYFSNTELAEAYIDFSRCLKSLKKFKESTEEATAGITILERQKSPNLRDSLVLESGYLHLANTLKDTGQYNAAEKNYKYAVALTTSIKDTVRVEVALLGLGLAYRYEKQFSLSEKTLTGGLQMIRLKGEISPFLLSLTEKYYSERSQTYMQAKKYGAAISDQDAAIALLTEYQNDPVLNADLTTQRHNLLSLTSDKATAYIALYDQGVDKNGYVKAKALFDSLPSVLEDIRANYMGEEAKLNIAENAKPAFEKAIALFLTMYQRERGKKYLYAAFDFAEQSKNMVLFDNVRLNNRLPDSLQKERKAINQLEADLSLTKDAEMLQHLLTRKRNLVGKIKAFTVAQKTSVPDIQRQLLKDGRSSLVEYFTGDSAIYVFTLTATDLKVKKIAKPSDFEQKITAFRESVMNQNNDSFARLSSHFYQVLLNDVLTSLPKEVDRLIVVPDGSLNTIAFESLIQDSVPTDPAKHFLLSDAHFLIQKYAVGYAPSANLLLEQTITSSANAGGELAVFAPQYQPRDSIGGGSPMRAALTREKAYDLPHAKEEATRIQKMLNGSLFFIDKAATVANFKEIAGKCSVLHLSMHCITDENNPADTRLLFTKNNRDSAQQCDLTIPELNGLSLDADMAVLSACNTGSGKWSKGEGVMSVARAFHQAGVRSTVMSLWKASDTETSEIMIHFYENLKKGMKKDEALRQAKLTYFARLKGEDKAAPIYWAPFVLSGKNDALVFEDGVQKKNLFILGGIMVALGGILTFWKFYSKKAKKSVNKLQAG